MSHIQVLIELADKVRSQLLTLDTEEHRRRSLALETMLRGWFKGDRKE